VKRGEVWSAATGSGFGSKPRPVVIVQGEVFGETPNVIVALCNSAIGEPDDVRPRIQPDPENGLENVSDVSVDILVTVPRRKFGQRFGQLSAADQSRVFSTLFLMLGFAE
jgi:mRNA interferase MazF